MPKIAFNGVEYDGPADMPPDVRSQYEKAARNLPDRDANGVPDLLESDNIAAPLLPPAITTASAIKVPPTQIQKAARWLPFIVGGSILVVIACVALFFFAIMSLIKGSEAYQLAVQTARAHPTAQEVLGAPIQEGWFPTGSISEEGANGSADLEINLSGSANSGTLMVRADKENNTWTLVEMQLQVGDRQYALVP
jgi:hypothetical protein